MCEVFDLICARSALPIEWLYLDDHKSQHRYRLAIDYGHYDHDFSIADSIAEYHKFMNERNKHESQIIGDLRSVFHEFMIELCY
jgi:hypothetical protein